MASGLSSSEKSHELAARPGPAVRRVWLLANPNAGRGLGKAMSRQVQLELQRAGIEVELTTDHPESATPLTLPDACIAIGGDGTQRVVVKRIVELFPDQTPPLLPVPLGTANLLAQHLSQPKRLLNMAADQVQASLPAAGDAMTRLRHFLRRSLRRIDHDVLTPWSHAVHRQTAPMLRHLSRNWTSRSRSLRSRAAEVVRLLQTGQRRPLDLPTCNGELFLLMVGVGFDAHVVHRLHQNRVGSISLLNYVIPTAMAALQFDFPALRVSIGGRDVWNERGLVIVANLPPYGTGFPLAPDARGDDGLLDVVCLPCKSRIELLQWLGHITTGQHVRHHNARTFRTDAAKVTCDKQVAVQIDGDPAQTVPLDVTMTPRQIELIGPARMG